MSGVRTQYNCVSTSCLMLFFLDRRTKDTKEFHTQRICSLCSYVLINYPYIGYADTIKLCPYVRGYITPLNPCFARFFTLPNDFFLGHKDKRYKRISRTKNMFLMFLCLNKLSIYRICGCYFNFKRLCFKNNTIVMWYDETLYYICTKFLTKYVL